MGLFRLEEEVHKQRTVREDHLIIVRDRGEADFGGTRSGGELVLFPPDLEHNSIRGGRSQDKDLEVHGREGVGARHAVRTHQQRVLRVVPHKTERDHQQQ